jgi:hypothetical protein
MSSVSGGENDEREPNHEPAGRGHRDASHRGADERALIARAGANVEQRPDQ